MGLIGGDGAIRCRGEDPPLLAARDDSVRFPVSSPVIAHVT